MTNPVRARRRSIRLVAAAAVVGVVSTSIVAAGAGSANAADKQLSHATGRFLSGSFAGTSFDTIAGIEGESASFPADPGANKNSLNAELLNGALKLPFGEDGLQLPSLGGIQLGAVAQYAKANSDGSALGATGAVDSNGGIGIGGSDGVPTGGATIDLSGLPGASAVTSIVGNVKLTIGAVSSRAKQVAIGKKIEDPTASCVNGPYTRVSDPDQAGEYNIAGLTLDAQSPLLSTLGTTLINGLGTLLTTLNTNLKALGALVTITGLPTADDLTKDLTLSLAGGSITASLADGKLSVDVEKLLKFLGLDLNNLCANTNLLSYVADALAKLPAALAKLIGEVTTKLTDSLGAVTVTVAGVPLSLSALTDIINPLVKTLTDGLSTALGTLNTTGLQPLIDILTSTLLKIVVNGQSESDGVLTETALQLNVLPGGAALPEVPGLPPLPIGALSKSAATKAMAPGIKKAEAAIKKAQSSKSTTSNFAGGFTFLTKLDRPVLAAAAARPLSAPVALKAPGDPALQLNLAQSTVGPNAAAAPPSTTVPTTTVPTTNVPSTIIPTGVPAGAAGHGDDGGLPVLPLIALLMLLSVAGGSYWQLRLRGNGSH